MTIFLTSLKTELEVQATSLAKRYNIPLNSSQNKEIGLQLQLTSQHLQLVNLDNHSYGPLYIDFIAGKTDHRRLYGGGKSQLLAKSVGLNKGFKGHILDATAGLAGDGFVLASLGCQITLLERSPILSAMIDNALQDAQKVEGIRDIIKSIKLIHTDSLHYLCMENNKDLIENKPDIIYLDPMFPDKKGSALVKKEMQYLQLLIGKDLDSSQLLCCAIKQAKYRVVVKRPAKAPYLDGQQPQLELSSKKQRFDIYINKKLPIK
jgi:16S rRNA (guanine1516-N2)-methyltransferase